MQHDPGRRRRRGGPASLTRQPLPHSHPNPDPDPKPNQVSAGAHSGLAYALKGAVLGAAAGFGYSKVAA